MTRSYLAADGREMTDVWVLDYMDGNLIQYIHQTASDENWGAPRMSLTYGSHHIYFIASRGTEAVLDTEAATVRWQKPSDTFWTDYSVDVVSTSNGNRAVTLERVATKLKLTVTDSVPASCATVAVTTATWYDTIDYIHGSPLESQNKERNVAVPENYIGTSGQLAVTLFALSSEEEWHTDVTITARTPEGSILGTASMTDVPLRRNRQTEYSGPLFGAKGTMTVNLNDSWDNASKGTW